MTCMCISISLVYVSTRSKVHLADPILSCKLFLLEEENIFYPQAVSVFRLLPSYRDTDLKACVGRGFEV